MATEFQNWLKAYRRKKPNAAVNKDTKAAYQRWKDKRAGRSGGGTGTTPKPPSLPDGWGTTRTPDVLGSWKDKPNLNPNDYEIGQNADGAYFARPRTEMTGLQPWMVQSLRRFDDDARKRQELIGGVQTQGINANKAIGDAGATRMNDLATLIQTRSGTGEAGAGAQAGMAAAQEAATQAAANAQNAATNSNTLLTASLASLANKERSDTAASRQSIMQAYRNTIAAADNAKTAAIAKTYTDQARILAASIQAGARITEQQISDLNANLRNTQDNETSIANNALDNVTSGNNAGNNAAGKARAANAKKRDEYLKKIPDMLRGDISVTTGADGRSSSTVRRAPMGWQAVINDAAAKGIPLGSVLGVIASDPSVGAALKRNRTFQTQVANLLRSKGVPAKTVRAVMRKHLGVDPGANPGVFGPPSP